MLEKNICTPSCVAYMLNIRSENDGYSTKLKPIVIFELCVQAYEFLNKKRRKKKKLKAFNSLNYYSNDNYMCYK